MMTTTPPLRRASLCAAAIVLLVPMLACGFSDDDQRTYRLDRCGMQLELGAHFSQTAAGPDRYAFATADGSLEVEAVPAPPGSSREPATFLPLTSGGYDYDRAGTFAGFPAREARAQEPAGADIRARWGAAIDTPQGLCYLRVTSVWNEGPDSMGERFWSSLHDRWLRPL